MSDDKKYKIEDFWPEAEELLNQHFDAKKGGNKSAFWMISLLLIITISGLTFIYLNLDESEHKNITQIKNNTTSDGERIQDDLILEKTSKKSKQKETNNSLTAHNNALNYDKNTLAKTTTRKNDSENNIDKLLTNNQEGQSYNHHKSSEQKSTLKTSNQLNLEKVITSINEIKVAQIIPVSNNNSELQNNTAFASSTGSLNKEIPNKTISTNSSSVVNSTSGNQTVARQEITEIGKSKNEPLESEVSGIETKAAQEKSNSETESPFEETLQNKKDSILTPQNNQNASIELIDQPEVKSDSAKNKKRISFGIFASAGMFNTSKNLTVNQELEAYKIRRDSEESSNINTAFSLGFQVKFNKIILKSGVELNKYGETINYSDWLNANQNNIIPKWTQFTDSLSFINYNYYQGNEYQENATSYFQDSLPYFDTTFTFQKTTTDLIAYRGKNTISYVEIPLSLTYILIQKPHFNLGISLGGSVGFLTQKSGFYIDESMQNIIDLKSSSIIRKSIVNGRLGLQAAYAFNPNSALFIEPQYRLSMQSVLNTPTGTTQKYRSFGLNLGYAYTF